MVINYRVAVGLIVLIASGLGLSLGLKFIRSIKKRSSILTAMWAFESPKIRYAILLIFGSFFVRPFLDLSSLLIDISKVPSILTQPVSSQVLPLDWDIVQYGWYLIIRTLLFGLVYGYAVWIVPKLMALFSSKNGKSINAQSFEGACIVFVTGSLLYGLIAPIAFGIQQLPILELLGIKNSIANYAFGWLAVFILIPVLLYGLNTVLRKSLKPYIVLGSNLPEQS